MDSNWIYKFGVLKIYYFLQNFYESFPCFKVYRTGMDQQKWNYYMNFSDWDS